METCIEFTGCRNGNGYGMQRYAGTTRLAHRVAYVEHHSLPMSSIDGKVIRHRCDNPACVNPAHLELGTQYDNVQDMHERQRARKANGESASKAKLTVEQVVAIRARYKPRCRTSGGAALGREFGVSGEAISAIVRGKNWKHLEDAS